MVEAKRAIEPLLVCQPRDRGERHKDSNDRKGKELYYVAFFVMANFMREHGFQLRVGELRDECVEQNDFSKTSEPGEEGVGMARALAAIHCVDTARGKIGALCQCKEALAQRSVWQWREFVEKRHDHCRRDEQQEQLKHNDNRRRP